MEDPLSPTKGRTEEDPSEVRRKLLTSKGSIGGAPLPVALGEILLARPQGGLERIPSPALPLVGLGRVLRAPAVPTVSKGSLRPTRGRSEGSPPQPLPLVGAKNGILGRPLPCPSQRKDL